MRNFSKETWRKYIPHWILILRREIIGRILLNRWMKNGCPVPPPDFLKHKTIQEYQHKYGYDVLIETGTFKGDMVDMQKKRFKKIISIELGNDLYEKAKKRFKSDKNVSVLQGDSGKLLPIILKDIHSPVIFWLDAHYMGGESAKGDSDCPIFEELDSIFSLKKSNLILLIDDARFFIGDGIYPTIEKLTDYIRSKNVVFQFEVKHDIIRYVI